MLTIDDDMKETISEIANAAFQTVDLQSTRLRQNLVESTQQATLAELRQQIHEHCIISRERICPRRYRR